MTLLFSLQNKKGNLRVTSESNIPSVSTKSPFKLSMHESAENVKEVDEEYLSAVNSGDE